MTTTTARPPTLRRRPPHYAPRRVAFFDPVNRVLALDTPAPHPPAVLTLASAEASELLRFLGDLPAQERPRVVYVCGGSEAASTPPPAWWHAPLADGWTMRQWHNAADRRTAIYERSSEYGDIVIDLRMSAGWFDADLPGALDAATCVRAWRILSRQLCGAFGSAEHPPALLATPAQTGVELFEASVPAGLLVETLPESLRDELHASIATQGRFELMPPRGSIASLVELDARWMYAACLTGLPVGQPQRDNRPEWAGYMPGFYRVWARVPSAWRHIGLLPHVSELGVTYPREPGQTFTGWVGGAELDIARRHGWETEILERLLWPATRQLPDVAETWATKLRKLRESAQSGRRAEDGLVAAALRHLVLDTVGRWYSRGGEEFGLLPVDQLDHLPPDAAPRIIATDDGEAMIEWRRLRPMSHESLLAAHPEWAATVWSRARARLVKQALTLPFERIVALRTDAIWLASEPGDLASLSQPTGQPGSWRIKARLAGDMAWPESEDALRALMARARGR